MVLTLFKSIHCTIYDVKAAQYITQKLISLAPDKCEKRRHRTPCIIVNLSSEASASCTPASSAGIMDKSLSARCTHARGALHVQTSLFSPFDRHSYIVYSPEQTIIVFPQLATFISFLAFFALPVDLTLYSLILLYVYIRRRI